MNSDSVHPTDPFPNVDQSSDRGKKRRVLLTLIALLAFVAVGIVYLGVNSKAQRDRDRTQTGFDAQITANGQQMLEEGRQIFRFDTFGDEAWWSDKLKLH